MKKYLAHVKQEESSDWNEHDLLDHLLAVANLAKEFADEFKSGNLAYYCRTITRSWKVQL